MHQPRCVLGEIKSSQGRNCAGGVCRIQNLPRDQKTSLEKDQDDDDDFRDRAGDDDKSLKGPENISRERTR